MNYVLCVKAASKGHTYLMDVVYEVMLKMGITLDTPVTYIEVNGKIVYIVGEFLLMVCLVMLTNENGEEEKCEFLDLIAIRNEEFVVLMPEEDDEKSVLTLRVDESNEDGVDNYSSVDDDELLSIIFEMFKERNKDKFDFSE